MYVYIIELYDPFFAFFYAAFAVKFNSLEALWNVLVKKYIEKKICECQIITACWE